MNREIQRVMHTLKFRRVRVKTAYKLSPKVVRVTFTGEDLEGFYSPSPDDHVKIFFPYPGESEPDMPTVAKPGNEPVLGARSPLMRDYTPRFFDAIKRELQIDFCIHEGGVGSDWARNAKPGDKIGVAGPRGSQLVPYAFDGYLMIADETGVPALGRRLSEMPAGVKAMALIEVADKGEIQEFVTKADVEVKWVVRDGGPAGDAERFLSALREMPRLSGECFAWVSCEKSCATALKAVLIKDYGFNEAWIKATGYWSRGVSGH